MVSLLFYCTYLMIHKGKYHETKFAPYLDLLPTNMKEFPIMFGKDDLKYLDGSPMQRTLEGHKQLHDSMYKQLDEVIPDFENFSKNGLLEMITLVNSRSTQAGDDISFMVPLADMFNHRDNPNVDAYFDNEK